jgi:hypothetical protein
MGLRGRSQGRREHESVWCVGCGHGCSACCTLEAEAMIVPPPHAADVTSLLQDQDLAASAQYGACCLQACRQRRAPSAQPRGGPWCAETQAEQQPFTARPTCHSSAHNHRKPVGPRRLSGRRMARLGGLGRHGLWGHAAKKRWPVGRPRGTAKKPGGLPATRASLATDPL